MKPWLLMQRGGKVNKNQWIFRIQTSFFGGPQRSDKPLQFFMCQLQFINIMMLIDPGSTLTVGYVSHITPLYKHYIYIFSLLHLYIYIYMHRHLWLCKPQCCIKHNLIIQLAGLCAIAPSITMAPGHHWGIVFQCCEGQAGGRHMANARGKLFQGPGWITVDPQTSSHLQSAQLTMWQCGCKVQGPPSYKML